MVCCTDDSLYSGVTTDLKRRVEEHNSSKKGAKYTSKKRPVTLVYSEKFAGRSSAQKREWNVKKLSRKQKDLLINGKK
jgi:putative endonuclease